MTIHKLCPGASLEVSIEGAPACVSLELPTVACQGLLHVHQGNEFALCFSL